MMEEAERSRGEEAVDPMPPAADRVRAELSAALMERDYERAARVECSSERRLEVVRAERAAAQRDGEPAAASRVFTAMGLALQQQGKFADAVAMLAEEAILARTLSLDLRRACCVPADELEVLDLCLVRPEREQKYEQDRETTRDELFDLFGVWIGSTRAVREGIAQQMKKDSRKRKRMLKVSATGCSGQGDSAGGTEPGRSASSSESSESSEVAGSNASAVFPAMLRHYSGASGPAGAVEWTGSRVDRTSTVDRISSAQNLESGQDLESLQGEVEQIETMLRHEARQILVYKLCEERVQVSLAGQPPHEDGCYISWRHTEAFNTACSNAPVRKTFMELLKKMYRAHTPQHRDRDRLGLRFADTLYHNWRTQYAAETEPAHAEPPVNHVLDGMYSLVCRALCSTQNVEQLGTHAMDLLPGEIAGNEDSEGNAEFGRSSQEVARAASDTGSVPPRTSLSNCAATSDSTEQQTTVARGEYSEEALCVAVNAARQKRVLEHVTRPDQGGESGGLWEGGESGGLWEEGGQPQADHLQLESSLVALDGSTVNRLMQDDLWFRKDNFSAVSGVAVAGDVGTAVAAEDCQCNAKLMTGKFPGSSSDKHTSSFLHCKIEPFCFQLCGQSFFLASGMLGVFLGFFDFISLLQGSGKITKDIHGREHGHTFLKVSPIVF